MLLLVIYLGLQMISFINAFFELGETYFALGNYKKAKTAFTSYAERDKGNKEVKIFLKKLKKLGY